MELKEKRLVSEVIRPCSDPVDTASCFLNLGHLCHHFITTAPWLNNIGWVCAPFIILETRS